MIELLTHTILNLKECTVKGIFESKKYPWEVLTVIEDYIYKLIGNLDEDYAQIEKDVWVGKGTTIAENVLINGPAVIGSNCEIRHGAYIRGNVIIGNEVVIGNSTEIKNSIIFNKAQIPHFNYVGDSILGYKAHLGAGVILSNLKSDNSLISIKIGDKKVETNLRKMGAIIGDNVEIGSNTVLNPGTVIGKNTIIYPMTFVRGMIPQDHILKNNGELVRKK